MTCQCQNHRTEAAYQSVADKVLYKYLKISQIRLSSDPHNFDNLRSINIYIHLQCEISAPYDTGYIQKRRGQSVI